MVTLWHVVLAASAVSCAVCRINVNTAVSCNKVQGGEQEGSSMANANIAVT